VRWMTCRAVFAGPYTVGTRAGTILAGSGSFEITLTGAGGHAAAPHKNIDVVICGSAAGAYTRPLCFST
jgi:IAA-amino acid hydrolase